MTKIRFKDIVREVKENVDRNNNPYKFFVAGEHMDTDELHLLRRGIFEGFDVGPAFVRIFKPGQILYGSRRTYLRKIAVADFAGITANTTFVLETKDEKVLLQRLLPFIMQSERFTKFSIERSKGSTNPYILFTDLCDYEIDLPDIIAQEKIAQTLWAIDATKTAYKRLIAYTDKLVESQFIEMFGSIDSRGIYPVKQWKKVLRVVNGKDYKSVADSDGLYPVYGSGGFMGRATKYLCPENTIVIGRKGTIDRPFLVKEKFWNVDTTFGIVPDPNVLHYVYLLWYCKQLDFNNLNKPTTLPSLTKKDLLALWISVPPLEHQKRFASFVEQSDKSKLELEQALAELTATYKRIIAENLG